MFDRVLNTHLIKDFPEFVLRFSHFTETMQSVKSKNKAIFQEALKNFRYNFFYYFKIGSILKMQMFVLELEQQDINFPISSWQKGPSPTKTLLRPSSNNLEASTLLLFLCYVMGGGGHWGELGSVWGWSILLLGRIRNSRVAELPLCDQ